MSISSDDSDAGGSAGSARLVDRSTRPAFRPGEQRPIDADVRPCVSDHELLSRIGSGSYGDVWLARNMNGQYRAVKVIYRGRFDNARPFERELRGVEKYEPLSRGHEGLVDLLHVGRDAVGCCFFYIMEVADDVHDGQQIRPGFYRPHTLRAELKGAQRLPVAKCVELGIAMVSALQYIHSQGLVHRDLKPSNLIFVGGILKLADIGLIASADESQSFVGTEGYIPLDGPLDQSTDLYAVGKILYEACTGCDRLDFPTVPEEVKSQPDAREFTFLNTVILRACDPVRRKRFHSAGEMLNALNALKQNRMPKRTKGKVMAASLALVAALACAGAFLAVRSAGSNRSAASPLRPVREFRVPDCDWTSDAHAADWDGDGRDDLLVTANQALHILSLDGQVIGSYGVGYQTILLTADLDGDGGLDVLLRSSGSPVPALSVMSRDGRTVRTYSYGEDGGQHHGRPDSTFGSACVTDLDDDGVAELVATVTTGYGRAPRGVLCFNLQSGVLLWKYLFGPIPQRLEAADLDGDGKKEIIIGTGAAGNGNVAGDGTDDSHAYLHVINSDGSLRWIKNLGDLFVAVNPYVARMPGTNAPVIVAMVSACADFRTELGRIVVFGASGALLAERAVDGEPTSVVLADLDGDSCEEIIVGTRRGRVIALDMQLNEKGSLSFAERSELPVAVKCDGVLRCPKGRQYLAAVYSERRFVFGDSPRNDEGPRNVRYRENNSLILLDAKLNPFETIPILDQLAKDADMRVLPVRLHGPDQDGILCLADRVMVYSWAEKSTLWDTPLSSADR